MDQSWSEYVGTQEWRREAELWIHDVLGQREARVTGPIEHPRIRPWSTQMIVPTDRGKVWFKANCPAFAFEPALQQTLARLIPHEVDAPIGIDVDRGWMLTEDHGLSLGELEPPTLADWQAVVSTLAQVQRELLGHRADLFDARLPDCSPATVPDRFDRLVERLMQLRPDHPSYVDAALARRLEQQRPRVVDAVQRLDASPIPSTFQHGDAHPHNAFADGDRIKVFDFGDSMWSFALESMSVPFGMIAASDELDWEPIAHTYREHWTDLVTPREYESLWQACGLTHAVNRSATWWQALQGASVREWVEWGQGPRRALVDVLDAPCSKGEK